MPAIIILSSHVAHGAVGNRIMTPVLEATGFTVIAVPTVVLPWHPGMAAKWGRPSRSVPDAMGFAALAGDLARAAPGLDVAGVITGYLGDAEQAHAAADLIAAVKAANPSALCLCDPVIGDAGGLYVPEATAKAIRDVLLPLADIATPNRFELEWLTGLPAATLADTRNAARRLGPAMVAVTSVRTGGDDLGGVLLEGTAPHLATHALAGRAPNGTGDMFAAAFLARLIRTASPAAALADSVSAVLRAIHAADGGDGLPLPAAMRRLEPDAPDIRLERLPDASA
jgi:pyridoxine kinase